MVIFVPTNINQWEQAYKRRNNLLIIIVFPLFPPGYRRWEQKKAF
nr:MAG TPA: hypothetical protein [Caudoviricetes sp.]